MTEVFSSTEECQMGLYLRMIHLLRGATSSRQLRVFSKSCSGHRQPCCPLYPQSSRGWSRSLDSELPLGQLQCYCIKQLFFPLKVFHVFVCCLSSCISFGKSQLPMGIYKVYTLPALLNHKNTVIYNSDSKSSPNSNMSLFPLINVFSVCYGWSVHVPPNSQVET